MAYKDLLKVKRNLLDAEEILVKDSLQFYQRYLTDKVNLTSTELLELSTPKSNYIQARMVQCDVCKGPDANSCACTKGLELLKTQATQEIIPLSEDTPLIDDENSAIEIPVPKSIPEESYADVEIPNENASANPTASSVSFVSTCTETIVGDATGSDSSESETPSLPFSTGAKPKKKPTQESPSIRVLGNVPVDTDTSLIKAQNFIEVITHDKNNLAVCDYPTPAFLSAQIVMLYDIIQNMQQTFTKNNESILGYFNEIHDTVAFMATNVKDLIGNENATMNKITTLESRINSLVIELSTAIGGQGTSNQVNPISNESQITQVNILSQDDIVCTYKSGIIDHMISLTPDIHKKLLTNSHTILMLNQLAGLTNDFMMWLESIKCKSEALKEYIPSMKANPELPLYSKTWKSILNAYGNSIVKLSTKSARQGTSQSRTFEKGNNKSNQGDTHLTSVKKALINYSEKVLDSEENNDNRNQNVYTKIPLHS